MNKEDATLFLAAGSENSTTNTVVADGSAAEGPKNLIPYPHGLHSIYYLTTETAVNGALRGVVDGVVGFDTEFAKRKPTSNEEYIGKIFSEIGGNEKWGILALQLLERQGNQNSDFPISTGEILTYTIDKEERLSDWTDDLSKDQKIYTAMDAAVSLRLYEELAPALDHHRVKLGVSIPPNWYSMNSKFGEPMRKIRNIWGEELPWSVKDCYWCSNKVSRLFSTIYIKFEDIGTVTNKLTWNLMHNNANISSRGTGSSIA
ncbi:hypothetical protein C8F04DRAFT_1189391 [Mycena alexandri]|uniref:Uncharacterized protein n=1 Tax=Mycena alexandri TaxID=1745969 RepID=A0AAD6SHH4_9AGAR|nr:hypothetical protein C8F04DRAFT_1189391 [Mycena alexandri]